MNWLFVLVWLWWVPSCLAASREAVYPNAGSPWVVHCSPNSPSVNSKQPKRIALSQAKTVATASLPPCSKGCPVPGNVPRND